MTANDAFANSIQSGHALPVIVFDGETNDVIRSANIDLSVRRTLRSKKPNISIDEIIHPDETEMFGRAIKELNTGDFVAAGLWNFRDKEGRYRPFEIVWRKEIAKSGAQIYAILLEAGASGSHEPTGETASSTPLHQDVFSRTAYRLVGIGTWKMQLNSGGLQLSAAARDIYGVPFDEAAEGFDGYLQLVHPDDRADTLSRYKKFRSSAEPYLEFRHRVQRADRTQISVKCMAELEVVDGQPWLFGVVQSISDADDAQAKFSESVWLQRIAGQVAQLGGWRFELNPSQLIWSPETATIHEEAENTMPSVEKAINYYIPEHQERVREVFEACLENGSSYDEVLQIVTAKANRKWVRTIGEAAYDGNGKIVGVQGAFQDITQMVHAQEAAQVLSRRLWQTLESISDAFFLLDDQWRFQFLNSQAENLLGRDRQNLLGQNVWLEFPEAVGSIFQMEYERAVTQSQTVRFREYYSPLDTWFEVNAHPTSEGLAVYFRDITQQRARDQQLRLLETAVSHQNDILLITEGSLLDAPDGPRIIYVNDAFERRTGYSREEVIGQTPRILQGPKTQRAELDRIRYALEMQRPVRAELINYCKSGEEFWLELDIVPLIDELGCTTHQVAIQRDITERKKIEQELRTSEERFRLVAKASGNAVWDWDIASGRRWWSEGMTTIFGHTLDADEKNSSTWRRHVHDDDQERIDRALDRLLSGESQHFHEEYRFQCGDGSWKTVEDKAFVVRAADGSKVRILGSLTDISERIHLHERLRQAQKLEAIGQLTGGVAHDFNNLLTVIMGNTESLSRELSGNHYLRQLADMSVTAAARGAELTNRLLAFSRKQALEPKLSDISRLIQGMEDLIRRTLPESIDIEIVRSGGLWKAEVDQGQLESALLNLAINGRDAMPDGGRLTIEIANASLDDEYVRSEQDVKAGQYVVVIVSDTGEGIPRELLDRVFEPFFTTKQKGKGTGLGLSMVYGFVKQSGGHIRVYSELGEGTSIKLYFPRSFATSQLEHSGPAVGAAIGGSEKILVVEDDDLVRAHLVTQLNGLGYHVIEAAAGHPALKILERDPDIDLLFTDIVMPGGMDGRALADAARAMRPTLKVLFTSGYTENAIVHNGRLDRGVDLLSKPYRREQLASKVRKVLDA